MATIILLLVALAGIIFFLISPAWLAPDLPWLRADNPEERR